jgi:hypothetical protein
MTCSVLEVISDLGAEFKIPLKLFYIFVRNMECIGRGPLRRVKELEDVSYEACLMTRDIGRAASEGAGTRI